MALRMHPVARAALTSGSLMAVADIACQRLTCSPSQPFRCDWRRVARFGLVGATLHGPFFYWGLAALDKRFGAATTILTAVKKTATGQVTLFPTYLAGFFLYMGLLEGRSLADAAARLSDRFLPTYSSGSAFWPLVNLVNFRFVPPPQRLLYLNACGLLWNAFLRYYSQHPSSTQLRLASP
ncbi:hypothetical protein V8C86DRAFT_2644125 [Haematococcus lacustris]